MQKFIQVNGVVINPDHIVSATSERDSSQFFRVALTLTSQIESSRASCLGGDENLATSISTELLFDGEEAEALWSWLTKPDRTEDLLPNKDTEVKRCFQQHLLRGGDWTFDFFRSQFNEHQRLCQLPNPSDPEIDRCRFIEGSLLCF